MNQKNNADSFLPETARTLYERYGDGVSELRIVMPSRRARVFFNDALASIAGKPLWQPVYLSVDDLMEEIAGTRRSDRIRLIAELYKCYSVYHEEEFDRFYHWGETLLSDFDSVDKYLIDARTLFVNISDLKSLESDLSYLSKNQIAVIRRFWEHFNVQAPDSPEKREFCGVWNTLYDVYRDYGDRLDRCGMAYTGRIYRRAAEILKGDFKEFDRGEEKAGTYLPGEYAFVGFNALSETEKTLFDYLQRSGRALFFWDYDHYYTDSPEQEAGLFIRENLLRYPPSYEADRNSFSHAKEIVSVAVPSDAMQVKEVTVFLEELLECGIVPDKETAIVLTDEHLLTPVLSSIPPAIDRVNVTMGFPLRQTPAYTFTERLIELQRRKRTRNGKISFYHSDVTGLLTHPYLAGRENARQTLHEITEKRYVYVPEEILSGGKTSPELFRAATGWQELSSYLTGILDRLCEETPEEAGIEPEIFGIVAEEIAKVSNTVLQCGLDVSDTVFLSILRKALQGIRIPFEGEPLQGIQVMGILETRNLDFENVILLSLNDDTFPGNLSAAASYIPFNLRFAYGLPTPQHHEGVYAYYFYRLLQRAKKIRLVHSSKSDDRKTGEPSRYIYQLDYESPHPVEHRETVLNVRFPQRGDVLAEKTDAVLRELDRFCGENGDRKLTPSSFHTFIECPLKFYYRYIAGIREQEELTEEVDLPMFGNIFHKAAEILYGSLCDDPSPHQAMEEWKRSGIVESAVRQAICEEYYRGGEGYGTDSFGGNLEMIAEIVRNYLESCLIPYDLRREGLTVKQVEGWMDARFAVSTDRGELCVRFGGKSDRIDTLSDGSLFVVDYKTGARKNEFKGIAALFSDSWADRNGAVLQILLYAMMTSETTEREVVPGLYFVRFMNEEGYDPAPQEIETDRNNRKTGSRPFSGIRERTGELREHLDSALSRLFSRSEPFQQCTDRKTCAYCPYTDLCRR